MLAALCFRISSSIEVKQSHQAGPEEGKEKEEKVSAGTLEGKMTSTPLNPAATPFLPAITDLHTLPDAALLATLDLLFEPSTDLHALALPTLRRISFDSYPDLIDTIGGELLAIAESIHAEDDNDKKTQGRRALLNILGSHPRLGEPKKETLSGQSAEEQRKLQEGGAAGAGEKEKLAALNTEYEARFPGLRYVVFVNGRGRGEIMLDMRRRIDRGDAKEEEREAIRVSLFRLCL